MSDITYNQYWTEISSIADELVSEAMESTENNRDAAEEEINDYRLHEWVDGHQWVIYYAYNDDVRKHSDNEDYLTDNFGNEYAGQIVAESGIDALGTAIAFWCMYADVQDKLSDAFDNYENELEECA